MLNRQQHSDGQDEPGMNSRLQSLSVQSPGLEVSRLQELLGQALKREAESHRKMKHLYEQLQNCTRGTNRIHSMSDASQGDMMSWSSDLSQTSVELSPTSPPAVVVVDVSPRPVRKSLPLPLHLSMEVQRSLDLDHLTMTDDTHMSGSHLNHSTSPDSSEGLEGHLSPCVSDYRGVRQEMEKPPSSNSPLTMSLDSAHISCITSPPVHSKAHFSPAGFFSPTNAELVDNVRMALCMEAASKTLPSPSRVGRSSSNINSKQKINRAHHHPCDRSRSNAGNFLPGWIRRKISSTSNPPNKYNNSSLSTSRHCYKESLDNMFDHFVQVTGNMQQDSLSLYIDMHWSEVCKDHGCNGDVKRYRDAVWDLFQTEAKFLILFLQPLEKVYKGFLEELHFHGRLMIADVDKIFVNLSELCELSTGVATDLFKLFEGRSGDRIARTSELVWAFSMFGHKFNPVYQRFCVNFEKQRGFLRALEQLPDFKDYERVCMSHETVRKKDLNSLLISPIQHQCRYQLLLENVLKYAQDQSEKELLSSAIKAFVVSLKELESNIDENRRSEELLMLQETLCWPTLSQLQPSAYIPEVLHSELYRQPCSDVLAAKDRQLVYHGCLKLLEAGSRPPRDVHVFLFTDLLLLTQQTSTHSDKKTTKKESLNPLTKYYMCGHPVLLLQLDIYDVPPHPQHGHLITLVEKNTFQQQVGLYSLQAISKDEKAKWFSQLTQTKSRNSPGFLESDI